MAWLGPSRFGASKAQAALAKIIAIISTVPPPPSLKSNDGDPEVEEASAVDLRLRLGQQIFEDPAVATAHSAAQALEDGSISAAESVARAAEGSSEGECDPLKFEVDERRPKDEGGNEISEITTSDEAVGVEEEKRVSEGLGYLDLLLEAVRQVSEEEEKKIESLPLKKEKRKRTDDGKKTTAKWLDLYEETAPVVRSKRGRSQALPSRYRDSVLEPWAKLPTVSRHGNKTTAAGP